MKKVEVLTVLLLASLLVGCKTTPTTAGGASGAPPAGAGASGSSTAAGSAAGGARPDAGSAGGDEASAGEDDASGGAEAADETGSGGRSIEDLDGQLDKSLEDFDGRVAGSAGETGNLDILDPTGRNKAGVAPGVPVFEEADVGSGDAGGAGMGGTAEIEDEEIAARAEEGGPEGQAEADGGAETQGAPGAGGGDGAEGETVPVPEDVGDGRGDDIVLRQIREAALKERDPVLREKLWDEYRRIKGQ